MTNRTTMAASAVWLKKNDYAHYNYIQGLSCANSLVYESTVRIYYIYIHYALVYGVS